MFNIKNIIKELKLCILSEFLLIYTPSESIIVCGADVIMEVMVGVSNMQEK